MRKILWTLVALMLMNTTAKGGFIDFSVAPRQGGSPLLKYDSSGTFSASGLSINSASGQGTPNLDGVTLPAVATMEFQTGQYLGDLGGTGWLFAPGGHFSITGSLDGSPTQLLFSGVFSHNTSIVNVGNGFKVAASGFSGQLSPDLAAAFGVQQTTDSGGLSLLLSSGALPGYYFESRSYQSGNVAITAVDAPSTAILLLIGLATSLAWKWMP